MHHDTAAASSKATVHSFPTDLSYEALYNDAPVGIAVVDAEGILVWSNPLGHAFLDRLIHPGHVMVVSQDVMAFRKHLTLGKPFFQVIHEQGYLLTPTVLSQKPLRRLIWMVPSASATFDWLTMQQDILQQRKLANLGQMMMEMAHEFNNPLTGISMGVQLLGMALTTLKKRLLAEISQPDTYLDLIGKMEQGLSKINESTARAVTLRQELLNYSRPNVLNLRPYQFRKLIGEAFSHFEYQPVFEQMTLYKSFLSDSPVVMADLSKIEQILYNLLKNAHEATQGVGTVWITERIVDDTVILEFKDNGSGITEAVLPKLFSPFLTTKAHNGNGLGLSISDQIITQHGGNIRVCNAPDTGGACFTLSFPKGNEPLPPSSQPITAG